MPHQDGLTYGAQVTVALGYAGGAPVPGTLTAVVPRQDGDVAVITVTADSGLYERGDVIAPLLAWVTPAGVSPGRLVPPPGDPAPLRGGAGPRVTHTHATRPRDFTTSRTGIRA